MQGELISTVSSDQFTGKAGRHSGERGLVQGAKLSCDGDGQAGQGGAVHVDGLGGADLDPGCAVGGIKAAEGVGGAGEFDPERRCNGGNGGGCGSRVGG